ncbi:MAG TPA: cupin domain-containing protein [Fimbriimonas sp.]|nr:cupin domain-containing protein [Fimbriimonas sp.]
MVEFADGFQVLLSNGQSQAATMVIAPQAHEGGQDNRHKGADQWLYVAEGSGEAIIQGRRMKLEAGSLVLIARGEEHEVRNTGRIAMKTLNFYVPPAYTADGEELPAGKAD